MIEQKLNYRKLERIRRMGDTVDLPLFDGPGAVDQPTYEPTDAKDTRNEAYKRLINLNNKEQLVYAAIQRLGGTATDKEIAHYLDWPINRVTGRRNALVKKDRVEKHGTKRVDGNTNTIWRIKR